MISSTTPYQNAVRLLYILVNGAEKLPHDHEHESDASGLFKGETKLHAMDFWIRYPDYLAYELIEIFENTKDVSWLQIAENIFDSKEPDLRNIPMMKYRFGAYDRVDNTLSILISKGLVCQNGTRNKAGVHEYHYFLMPSAYTLAIRIAKEFPILSWYKERAELVAQVAGERGGTALKEQQYKHASYANTGGGQIITPITSEVQLRLQELKGHLNIRPIA